MRLTVASILLVVAIVGIGFVGCEQPSPATSDAAGLSPVPPSNLAHQGVFADGVQFCGTPEVNELTAGQHIDAGSVTMYNDATNLYVTVYSEYGYQDVGENIKMWVGRDLLGLPRNGQGVPINGQFPYKATVSGSGTTYTFAIPLNSIDLLNDCGYGVYVVVHADVMAYDTTNQTVSGETAYGGDYPGDTGNRWWFYSDYTVQCCDPTPPPVFDHEETAYAKGGYIWTTNKKSNPELLPSLKLTQNRWGWAILVTGDGTTTYDIWAGAGLNNTANGTLVGTLTVERSGANVTVTYSYASGYGMSEAHVYVSNLAPSTIAPGQYGHTAHFTDGSGNDTIVTTYSYTTTVDDGSAPVWIVAHAVANW